MSKISELSDGGVIQGGDTLIAVRSGGNVKVTYGGTTTANIDGGTIDGTVIGGTTPAAGSFTTGSFTGTVTADSAKVENGTTSTVTISESTGSGTAELRFVATESFPKTKIVTDVSAGSLSLETLGNERLNIANNGDISFYEDTGSTAKLTWSAANESLTFGTNLAITTNEIDVATGDLTLDVAGDIILDADGADIIFADGGTQFGFIGNSSSNMVMKSQVQDKDIVFKGNDGGSTITALTLDMSDAGYATFNSGLNSGGVIELPQKAAFPATGFVHYTNSYLYSFGGVQGSIFKDRTGVNEFLKLQPSQIVLNEDGGDIDFRVESDSNTHALFVDAASSAVGINNAGPQYGLDLKGSLGLRNGGLLLGRDSGSNTGGIYFFSPNASPSQLRIYRDTGLWGGSSGAENVELQLYDGSNYNLRLNGTNGVSFDGGSNYLDDYEEGTWTPAVQGSGGGTYTHSGITARYTKIGNLVTIDCQLVNITISGSGHTGYLSIAGAPFAKRTDHFPNGPVALSSVDFTNNMSYATVEFITTGSTSVLYIRQHGDNYAGADLPVSAINSGTSDIAFTIQYMTA